jgi:hypothetical protein
MKSDKFRNDNMHEIQPEQNSHNESPLLEELTTAYKDLSTKRFVTGGLGLTDALQCSDIRVSALAHIEIDKFGRKLNQIIVKDGRFPGDSVRMVQGDGGACGFYPQFVGVPLIRRTLQTGNPVEAIEWLQKVLGITVASGKVIHALWGVSVEEEIQLAPNVKIVPIELLPDSEQKQWITGHSYFRSGSPVASMLNFMPAKSALVTAQHADALPSSVRLGSSTAEPPDQIQSRPPV